MSDTSLIACHECDLIHRVKLLPGAGVARCSRCDAVLYRHKTNSLERTLAFSLAGLILFVVANSFPFLAFEASGQVRQTTLITGVQELYAQGLQGLAVLVMITIILAPLAQLLVMLYVMLPLRMNRTPPKLMTVFRFLRTLQPWSMMEVFMIGILVSIVKLAKMAKIVPGLAIFAYFALILVLAAAAASIDPHDVWDRWEPR